MGKALTLKIVKERLKVINPFIEIIDGNYKNNTSKLKCRCLIDGYEWFTDWANLSQGKGCHECNGGVRLTLEKIKNTLSEISPTIKIISNEYINSKSKLDCECEVCGNKWSVIWDSLKQSCGCPKCAKNKLRRKIEEIKNELSLINPNVIILSDIYINNIIKLKCVCSIDGNEFMANWGSLSQGVGCPECGRRNTVEKVVNTLDGVKDTLKEISPTIKITSKRYISNKEKLSVRCEICGHEWETRWLNLVAGNGCPNCYNNRKGWTLEKWIEMSNNSRYFDSYKLYILRCYDDHQSFIKIGMTFTTVKRRYPSRQQMPYSYDILKIIESDNPKYIWDLEKKIKQEYNKYKTKPKLKFAGSETECFSESVLEEVLKQYG